jgi:integrase
MVKVSLRKKAIKGNRQSLYLDFYPAIPHPETGLPTRREFLGHYVFTKPKSEADKQYNKDTVALAEAVRSKRQIDLQQNEYDFLRKKISDVDFIEYFDKITKEQEGVTYEHFVSCGKHLVNFTYRKFFESKPQSEVSKKFVEKKESIKGLLRSSKVDEAFCIDFRKYMLSAKTYRSDKINLAQNSAFAYFKQFKKALDIAFKNRIIKTNLNELVESIPQAETTREFLTLEELQKLVTTPCSSPLLKEAALFSALTGLRWSDIEKLKWGELRHSKKDGYSIRFEQQKTSGHETLPISEEAYNLLGEPGLNDQRVFEGLKYSAYTNIHFKTWIYRSGISREITFHSMRHTYATLLLSNGIDLYTVSKMLGHKSLETTQIYAKVIDKKKQEAANTIKLKL